MSGGNSEGPKAPAAAGPPPEASAHAPPRETLESEILALLGDVRSPVPIPKDYRPTETSSEPLLRVELPEFAGPMDLLLFLVRRHELNVFDIPIRTLAERYEKMLDDLKALHVDVAGEFLVLAAELAHIKSKMLLPAKEGVPIEEPIEPEGDPRAELIRRLLEYQKYRDAAAQLADRDQLGRDVFPRIPPRVDSADDIDPGLRAVSIFKLVEVMASMLKKTSVHHEITRELYTIGERIQHVLRFGDDHDGRFELVALLTDVVSRAELVVTFIAVLEMTRLGLLRIWFEDSSSPPEPAPQGTGSSEPVTEVDPTPTVEEEEAAALSGEHPPEVLADEAVDTQVLVEQVEALAAELEQLEQQPLNEPLPKPKRSRKTKLVDEPLPVVWLILTGKRFEGDLLDDYR